MEDFNTEGAKFSQHETPNRWGKIRFMDGTQSVLLEPLHAPRGFQRKLGRFSNDDGDGEDEGL